MYKKMTIRQFITNTVAFILLYSAIDILATTMLVLLFEENLYTVLGAILYATRYAFAYGAAQRILKPKTAQITKTRVLLFLLASYGISMFITYFDPINGFLSGLLGYEFYFYSNFFSLIFPPILYLGALLLAYQSKYHMKLVFNAKVFFGILFMLIINFLLSQHYHQIVENVEREFSYLFFVIIIEVLDLMLIDFWICNADIRERETQALEAKA